MIKINEGKEKNLLKHNPWVFSGAIESAPEDYCGVDKVLTHDDRFIAWGYYDVLSHIQIHLISWNENEIIDDAWWMNKVKESVVRRKCFFNPNSDTNTFRIIHGEADGLAGVVADVYGRVIRIIISSRLGFSIRHLVVKQLESLLHPEMIVLNTDSSFCGLEKLHEVTEYYKQGEQFYPETSFDEMVIRESGIYYSLVPGSGQKSGFFCDQRENRKVFEKYCSGATVLDLCCYTGSFTLHALKAGAKSVDAYDASNDAVHKVISNVKLNVEKGSIPEDSLDRVTATKADVFDTLRNTEKNKYDVIVLDPPKLAKTQKALDEAKKGYKDLNRLAMEKIKNNGILVTCSCSGALSREDFRTVLAWSAKDARAELQILETLGQAQDHPIRVSLPETEYLKVFIVRVIK